MDDADSAWILVVPDIGDSLELRAAASVISLANTASLGTSIRARTESFQAWISPGGLSSNGESGPRRKVSGA